MSLVTSSPTTWKGPANVLDHATNEIASGSKLGIDATKTIPGVKATAEKLFNL